MKLGHKVIVILCASLLAALSYGQPSLTPHVAEYKVKIKVLGGQLNTELRKTDSGYIATHTIKPMGMSRMFSRGTIKETSSFYAAEDGIRPDKYQAVDTITRDGEDVDIRFDWTTGKAEGTVNDAHVLSVMDEIAHDRVSIQYQLMHDLINGGPGGDYVLFDVDELKNLNVRNIGRKTVKVPAGKFEAVGIQHQAANSKRITTLWCVEELDYLPVIIEQHRKGKLRVRAVLSRYTPNPAAQAVRMER